MDYSVADLFNHARLRALTYDGQLGWREGVLVQLPSKMKADVLKSGLLRLIVDCTVDPVSAMLPLRKLVRSIGQRSIVSGESSTTLLKRPFS